MTVSWLRGAMGPIGMAVAAGVTPPTPPTPTIEPTEKLTDGGLEAWTSATNLTSWTESVVGTSTINREATTIHGGTYAARFDMDASGSGSFLRQNGKTTAHKWYMLTMWSKAATAGKNVLMGTTNFPWIASKVATVTDTYAQYVVCDRASAGGTDFLFAPSSGAANANLSFYFDDVSIKEINLASMFATADYGTHRVIKAACTIVAGTRAGVVCNLDSAASPANFVIASHDGTTARLEKCVAGVYTVLVAATVAYSAGAYVEARRLAGTDTWQLWYNGTQRGTDQTISDAAIKAATLCGYFNSYSGNSFSDFSSVAS